MYPPPFNHVKTGSRVVHMRNNLPKDGLPSFVTVDNNRIKLRHPGQVREPFTRDAKPNNNPQAGPTNGQWMGLASGVPTNSHQPGANPQAVAQPPSLDNQPPAQQSTPGTEPQSTPNDQPRTQYPTPNDQPRTQLPTQNEQPRSQQPTSDTQSDVQRQNPESQPVGDQNPSHRPQPNNPMYKRVTRLAKRQQAGNDTDSKYQRSKSHTRQPRQRQLTLVNHFGVLSNLSDKENVESDPGSYRTGTEDRSVAARKIQQKPGKSGSKYKPAARARRQSSSSDDDDFSQPESSTTRNHLQQLAATDGIERKQKQKIPSLSDMAEIIMSQTLLTDKYGDPTDLANFITGVSTPSTSLCDIGMYISEIASPYNVGIPPNGELPKPLCQAPPGNLTQILVGAAVDICSHQDEFKLPEVDLSWPSDVGKSMKKSKRRLTPETMPSKRFDNKSTPDKINECAFSDSDEYF